MTQTIDQSYLKEYSRQFTEKICSGIFSSRSFVSGEDIVKLTDCQQLNLMMVKSLFVAWQSELEKLKKNPYFNYRDPDVEEALKQFMNQLSRAIRVSRDDFAPLLAQGVADTIVFAVDPKAFLEIEFAYSAGMNVVDYLKANRKYIKWHSELWARLIEATEKYTLPESLSMAFDELLQTHGQDLASPEELLSAIDDVVPLHLDRLMERDEPSINQSLPELNIAPQKPTAPSIAYEDDMASLAPDGNRIDPALAWARFESESYGFVKGSIQRLASDIDINQRFMFTRKLFFGNPEQLEKALKELDSSESFFDAIELLNREYIPKMGWDLASDELGELLFLVFRKFEAKS